MFLKQSDLDLSLAQSPAAKAIQPVTWWLTGLPGAGKTTIAQALAAALRADGISVCVLDGDDLRQGLSSDLGFSMSDREEQGRRVAEIARILNSNDIFVIVALISPSAQGRAAAKRIVGQERFIEVYVSTPLAVCQERDPKGWYNKAHHNLDLQLTGISSPYDVPATPDCIIDAHKLELSEAVTLLSEESFRKHSL